MLGKHHPLSNSPNPAECPLKTLLSHALLARNAKDHVGGRGPHTIACHLRERGNCAAGDKVGGSQGKVVGGAQRGRRGLLDWTVYTAM